MVRVRFDSRGGLGFDIEAGDGRVLARSGPYRSICRLESALGFLSAAASAPQSELRLESTLSGTALARQGSRAKVWFDGALGGFSLEELRQALADGRVLDDRPDERRRTNVTGVLCQFAGH